MRCSVNGKEVSPSAIARREMNFGQPYPEPAPPLPYQILIGKEDFVCRMAGVYEQYAREERADMPCHQTGEWPLLDRLQELDYPPLQDLLTREPRVFEGLVKEWLGLETLDHLVPGPEAGSAQFLINTIDRVAVANGEIRIEGQAYPVPRPVPSP